MNCRFDYSGKKGIITGAASGIGKALSLMMAEAGAELALVDWNQQGLAAVVNAARDTGGPEPLELCLDVSRETDVEQMVAASLERFEFIDFLVTSAGVIFRSKFWDIEPQEWDELMATNLRGLFLCCRAVTKPMLQRGEGVIVNVASVAGRSTSLIGGAHYAASKHAVVGLTRHMARELTPKGIRVNAFCPGATKTPMVMDRVTPEEIDHLSNIIPMGRLAEAEEQARVIAYMLSDLAAYTTGACLDSNGGSFMI